MYFVDYILSFLLGIEDEEKKKYISYGDREDALIVIVPSGFFAPGNYLSVKSMPKEPLNEIDGIPLLFGTDEITQKNGKKYIFADIIASSVYFMLLSINK